MYKPSGTDAVFAGWPDSFDGGIRTMRGRRGLLLLAVILGLGCVERKLILRSDPEGARVYIDGEPKGKTPADVPFVFYGTREILLRKRGYQTVKREVDLEAPFHAWFPLDFICENLIPYTFKDYKEYSFVLEAKAPPDEKAVLRRAAEIREEQGGKGKSR
jgi:hypothetical protein